MKRFLFLVFIVITSNLSFAQAGYITQKEKHNSIGIYGGFSGFGKSGFDNSWNAIQLFPNVEGLFGFGPAANDLLFSFKHKKHEFIAGLYGTTYWHGQADKFFIFGGTASYLYHFSKKKTHLFFEGNFKVYGYTTMGEPFISPYNCTNNSRWWSGYEQKAASICTIALHPAIGVEVKLWRFIYYQFAIGSGLYRIKANSVSPSGGSFNRFYAIG